MSAISNDSKPKQLTPKDQKDILDAVSYVLNNTGFGSVTITFKNGEIDEIASTTTRNPKLNRAA